MEADPQQVETTSGSRGFRGRGDHGGSGNIVTIGPRDSLIGKLTVDGEVRVQGLIEGELHATGDVTVEGTVNAPIEARSVTVRGQVTGDVVAKDRLVLAGSGVLTGNVKIGKLQIEEGATLNGNVTMSGGKGHNNRHAEEPAPEGEQAS